MPNHLIRHVIYMNILHHFAVGELENMLVWLNACLVNPSLHLAACRDRVWTSYQKNLVANIDDMTAVTNSRQAAAIVALQVMKTLVALNYSEAVPVQSYKDEIGEKEEDILAHIAGYLLRKRGHGEEGQALTSSPSKGLTSLMDRGGLTYAQDAFTSVVREFEIQFRQLPPRSVDFKRFEDSVIEQNVPFRFFQLLDGIDSASESKELFFRDILHLFFTVRAHHKCRHLMEKCAQFAKSTRKALRDSI